MALAQTTRDLVAVAREMSGAAEIAVDVEGDGFFRYRARLCTVQLATSDNVVVLDTLAIEDLAPLAALLGSGGPPKVVHDASFDARLLREAGIRLENVFDTSIAARFLSEQATGLSSLLSRHLGVEIDKGQQQSDWGVRPLTPHALEYLEQDVIHLLALARLLRQRVEETGIAEEAAEECRYVLRRAMEEPPDPPPVWSRVKGWDQLDDMGLSVLREATSIREAEARRRDVPPFKVAGNAVLLDLARTRPADVAAIARMRGMPRRGGGALARMLAGAVREGTARGHVPEAERAVLEGSAPPPAERAARRRRQNALSRWRTQEAKARGVDPQVVLPGHCLADLVERGAEDVHALQDLPGLGDCRVRRYGPQLVALCTG